MTTPPPPYVLVGIDGSDPSLEALDLAADEAILRDCLLRIVSVIHWPVLSAPVGPESGWEIDGALIRDARGEVDAAARRASRRHPGLHITTDVLAGAPASVLIEESSAAELLVVGHRGRGGFAALVTGSVPAQVATSARCPVLVARPAAPGAGEHPEGPVVVGVDRSAHAARAVEFAFDEASRRGVPLVAVQVWTEPVHPSNGAPARADDEACAARDEARHTVATALGGYREKYPGLAVEVELIRSADTEDALVRRSDGAALMVVGSRGRGALAGALLGSVGHALIHHAACPVAIVRPDGTDG
jgi:nucleotide-binding universal stress UspA family protein